MKNSSPFYYYNWLMFLLITLTIPSNAQVELVPQESDYLIKEVEHNPDAEYIEAMPNVKGRTTDAQSGQAVGNATVYFRTTEGVEVQQCQTDSNGNFDIFIPQGMYMIDASAWNYTSVQPFQLIASHENESVQNIQIKMRRTDIIYEGEEEQLPSVPWVVPPAQGETLAPEQKTPPKRDKPAKRYDVIDLEKDW